MIKMFYSVAIKMDTVLLYSAALILICHVQKTEQIPQLKTFSTISEMQGVIHNSSNILLTQIRAVENNLYKAQAMFGTLNVSLQFQWPLSMNGTIKLDSKRGLSIPDFSLFRNRIQSQFGNNSPFPLMAEIGIGNYGLSLNALVFKFEGSNLTQVQARLSIPGWDFFNLFYFKVLHPQIVITLQLQTQRSIHVKAIGSLAGPDSPAGPDNASVLPVEFHLPVSQFFPLIVKASNTDAISSYKHVIKLLTISQGLRIPAIVQKGLKAIKVLKLELNIEPRFSNISHLVFEAVASVPWRVGGDFFLIDVKLNIKNSDFKFSAKAKLGNQTLGLVVNQQRNSLMLDGVTELRDLEVIIRNMIKLSLARSLIPDFSFVKLFGSNLSGKLRNFEIAFSNAQKNLVNLSLLIKLTNAWRIFDSNLLMTRMRNATIQLGITSLNENPEVSANITGTIEIGNPKFLEYPFRFQIPHKVQSISLGLQSGKELKVNFANILRIGGLTNFGEVFKSLLSKADVKITELALVFPSNFLSVPEVSSFKLQSHKAWDFNLLRIVNISLSYEHKQYVLAGQLEFLGIKVHASLNWPPKSAPVISMSNNINLKDQVVPFANRVSRHLLNGESVKLNLKRVGLESIKDFTIKALTVTLSPELRSMKEVKIIAALPKYSWKLFDEFFAVENITTTISVVIGKSLAMEMGGDIDLMSGAIKIPFKMDIPTLSSSQNIDIALRKGYKVVIGSINDIIGFLKSTTGVSFPKVLGNFFPEIHIQKFEVEFLKKMAEIKLKLLDAECPKRLDVGSLGILYIDNLQLKFNTVNRSYDVYGNLTLGGIYFPVQFISNEYQRPMFRLLKPVTFLGLTSFLRQSFRQMLPKVNPPDGDLLGLGNTAFKIGKAILRFSKDLTTFIGFEIEISFLQNWSFFSDFFTLKQVFLRIKATGYSDVQVDYEINISGIMEFSHNERNVIFPLTCNLPSSPSVPTNLVLTSSVQIEMSDITLMPLVGKIIPKDLLNPVSNLLGPIRINALSVRFKSGLPKSLDSLRMLAIVLKAWKIPLLPITFQNITLEIWYTPSKFNALLYGKTAIRNHPIYFQIPFVFYAKQQLSRIHRVVSIQFKFRGMQGLMDFPYDLSLNDLASLLLPGFDLPSLFPDVFKQFNMNFERLSLRLVPPLTTQFAINGFDTKFHLPNLVNIIKDWLAIENVTADLDVQIQGGLRVSGDLRCLARFGSQNNGFAIRSLLVIPKTPSGWVLKILPGLSTPLTLTKATSLLLGGIDVKSLFPSKWLAKVANTQLKNLEVTFSLKPKSHIQQIKCLLQTDLNDIQLPLKLSTEKVMVNVDVLNPFDSVNRKVKGHLELWIKTGKATIRTSLFITPTKFYLELISLGKNGLNIADLATLVGGAQLLSLIPKGFDKVDSITLNKLNITFKKPNFDLQDIYVLCDLHDVDVGFSFPLPLPDPKNMFKAELKVSKLELVSKNKVWSFNANVDASFSGFPSKIDSALKNLKAVLKIYPNKPVVLEIKKAIGDINIEAKLGGMDMDLRIQFQNPSLIFPLSDKPEMSVDIDISGFKIMNSLLPFDVFDNQLKMAVSIKQDEPLRLQMKTLPILDKIIPCRKEGEDEFKCDFTWLCNKDSYVYVKAPSFSYTDGFASNADVKGIEKLCIPVTPSFLWKFIKKIPILGRFFARNIPLWPPPNIKKILKTLGFNSNNLPIGMERFIEPKFPDEILTSVNVPHNGPLGLSLKVANGESLNIINVLSGPSISGVIFREFTIGTVFGVPFVNVDIDLYLWNLFLLMPLSHLPKQNPLLINARDFETQIVCKDCFFIILGSLPIPIFAAPFHLSFPFLNDVHAKATVYHKKPGLSDFVVFASFIKGLVKFYTDKNYLLSMKDFGGLNASKNLLVVKLHHESYKTMLQLPKYMGQTQLKLDLPPFDMKNFYIGFMNYMKTFEIKWLLRTVPLRFRIIDAGLNIGAFQLASIKFVASTPDELRNNKHLWNYPVPATGDDALIIASLNTFLASIDLKIKAKSLIDADLNFTINAGFTDIVKVDLAARAIVNFKDMSNPLMITGRGSLYLFRQRLLTGQIIVTASEISASGELNLNFLGMLKLNGFVKAKFRSGEFMLSSKVGLQFIGVRLLNSYLQIRNSVRESEVKVRTSFMGSQLEIELVRDGLSLKIKASALIEIEVNINLGEIQILGKSLGKIQLNSGIRVNLRIAFPGKSSLYVSFYFLGEQLSLPRTEVDTKDCRPDRIPKIVIELLKEKALSLIKKLLEINPGKYLKAILDGFIKIGKEAIKIIKDILKVGQKIIGSVAKEIGTLVNNMANAAKEIAKVADQAKKAALQAAKAAREQAEKALKKAKETVKAAGKVVENAGKKLAQATEDLSNTITKVVRLDNLVKQGKKIVKAIGEGIKNIARNIERIAKKILHDIARGIRNALGRISKTIGGWLGKRSIYRRDALIGERDYFNSRKREMERQQSNTRTKLRSQERELKRVRNLEAMKRSARNKALVESETGNKNLDEAIHDEIEKNTILENIYNQGKCVSGENNCHPNATCLHTGEQGQSFRCMCRRGWQGNGIYCEMPIKQVSIIADEAGAVGVPVNIASFTVSGTNVVYKFSFQDSFNSSSYQTHTFKAQGVYELSVFAQNPVSNASDQTYVIIQEPVSSLNLSIVGDRRPCRQMKFIPTSDGTNVTFDIKFGDNTTGYNFKTSITHYYELSGAYTVIVIAKNLVSSINSTYFLKVNGTPCDQLYCDIYRIESKSINVHKPLSNIANQAWEIAKSSKENTIYDDPQSWKYLAVLNPLHLTELNEPYSKIHDKRRVYSINGSKVDMAFVYAGVFASSIKRNLNVNLPLRNQCGTLWNDTEVLMLEGLSLNSNDDILHSWQADINNDYFCGQKVLKQSRIRGSIDGYLIGEMVLNSTLKLSDVMYNYYCPYLENAIPLPFASESRYYVYLETLRSKYPQENRTLLEYINHIAEQIQGSSEVDDHKLKSSCLRYFAHYLSQRLKYSVKDQVSEDACESWNSCGECLSLGALDNCSWCKVSSKCLHISNNSTCNIQERITSLPCPNSCVKHSSCLDCTRNPRCGWCPSNEISNSGYCVEGDINGPFQPGICNKENWYMGQCDTNCKTTMKCSGFGECRNGKCICMTGYFGPRCSKLGCIYRVGSNDTANHIANMFQIKLDGLSAYKDQNGNFKLTSNTIVTLPIANDNKLCLNYSLKAKFHSLFPRLIRGSKNVANKDSYCGLYGSLTNDANSLFCRNISNKELCKKFSRCTWNALDPCTGTLIEGCVSLSTTTQLLVPENITIVAPISGNIETGKDFAQITGWPNSEWENYIVTVSHIRPKNITSTQAGGILALGALEGSSVLPKYLEVTITYKGNLQNAEEYLEPCAPGCAQLYDFGNGMCDTHCNVSECNFDQGDCSDQTAVRRNINLPKNMDYDIFTDKSWYILYKLYKMTREQRFSIKRGPLSVFALSENIVSEMIVSSTLSTGLLFDQYRPTITKYFSLINSTNSTKGQMIVALAKRIIEIGPLQISPYTAHPTDLQAIDISVKTLTYPDEFERALQVLREVKHLVYVKVESNSFIKAYYHVEIAQRNEVEVCPHYRYKIQMNNSCHAVHSCFGHGICKPQGSCFCDSDYEGLECKTSKCPNNCSSHGSCVNSQCICERGWKGKDCSTIKLCTDSCLDNWIGDGTCDPNCNIPLCNFDGHDCLKVCVCPKSWLGDGSCDRSCNTSVCDYDQGDCIKKIKCSPECETSMIGDGFCDRECNVDSCSFDNGDCELKKTCRCDIPLQGNGVCNKECNTKECIFDFGDCVSDYKISVTCPENCLPSMVGNGFCDLICNISSCGFDGEDCIKRGNDIKSSCSPGCLDIFLKDGSCDSVCNVKACDYDGGDCPKPIVEMCHAGCAMAMIGDGICQSQCFVSQCSYDAIDCECAPGCPHSSIANGICEPECLTSSCFYDKDDCTCSPEKCPQEIIGNGICNKQCNNRICNFDGGDCDCVAGCTVNSINDGWCDKECDVKDCHYDGLDCGGCKTESHLDLCDPNADCIAANDSLPFLRCRCKPGYYGDGYQCIEQGKCFGRSEICSVHAKCVNVSGTFECHCDKGWKGNGLFCENIDECSVNQHNCSRKSTCTDTIGSYSCKCFEGYSGNGINCYDINECETESHRCCANEQCINTDGSYYCTCKDGWIKANETKTNMRNSTNISVCTMAANTPYIINENCIDVDECAEELHNCSRVNGTLNSRCENSIGGFNCTCNAGWKGDGWFCTDVDECDFNDTCGENQLCRNTPGSFTCYCKDGWIFNETGTGTCEDKNECALGTHKCNEFATCTNTNGSYICKCREGFEDVGKVCKNYKCRNYLLNFQNTTFGNITNMVQGSKQDDLCSCIGSYRNMGMQCVDIDECLWETYDCPAHAPICLNTLGGYECQCNALDNSTCEVFNPCNADNNTCQANMTCVVSGHDHYCVCPSGYIEDASGIGCVDRDECLSPDVYNCPDNANCINVLGSYECRCRDGYFDSGGSCFEINECDATLSQRIPGRLEECKPGVCTSVQACLYYQGSANKSEAVSTSLICACDQEHSKELNCVDAYLSVEKNDTNSSTTVLSFSWHMMFNSTNSSSPIPMMFQHNCSSSNSVCHNTLGSYKCMCSLGYHNDYTGKYCYDEDECLRNDSCHPNASCTNTIGSFLCSCDEGFTGDGIRNCSDINECELGQFRCHVNATCINVEGRYVCQCKHGFQGNGTLCEDVDECTNDTMNQCHSRAVCTNYVGGYVCECTRGYIGNGIRCTDVDECINGSQICGSHATCYNVPSTYVCKCDPGWTGDGQNCTNVNECEHGTHSCIENSQCQDYNGGYVCNCNKGWERQWFEPYGRCSRCDSNEMCSGNGKCLRDGSCYCLSYFGGSNCSICDPTIRCSGHGTCDINGTCYCERGWTRMQLDCSVCIPEQLCSGHGQCNYDLATYSNTTCICQDGYTGRNCSNACPTINGDVCGIHGDCTKASSSKYPCTCHAGYQWNNSMSSCVDINECTEGLHKCITPAVCVNTDGSYRCKCPSPIGWSLIDGRRCKDNDECQYTDVCDIHATCQNYPGGFRCNCNLGWRGRSEHSVCTDIDECSESSHKCSPGSTCVNTFGSYKCICNPGYERVSEFQCVDINECARGIHGCHPQATCNNTIGSWRCHCNEGWYPVPTNARLPTCKDLNECVDKPGACPSSSTCVNTVGSYHCRCLNGWLNQGPHSCVDVNECTRNPCPSNSRCLNTIGSYKCHCNSGYDPRPPTSATSCSDVNECARGMYSCPPHSQCVNLVGSYRCDCIRCYHKYGSGCRANCRSEPERYSYRATVYYASYYTTRCGWHGLNRCTRSRQRSRQVDHYAYRMVHVAQLSGASCPCS